MDGSNLNRAIATALRCAHWGRTQLPDHIYLYEAQKESEDTQGKSIAEGRLRSVLVLTVLRSES